MTAIDITGLGLTGTVRATWIRGQLAHVFDSSMGEGSRRHA